MTTLLFTDIEGSTKLLHELGDAYAGVLAEHRGLLRKAFGAHGGSEVDTQGDAFFFTFTDPGEAVAAAAEAQAVLADGPVRVRMGLHTGEPTRTEEGWVGTDVHLGARIAAAGHGGQVLLSKATCDLVDGAGVRDLGEHRVKDFDEPVWIYQLGDDPFPPLKTISNTNLPRPASSFVGREREVSEVVARVRGSRLVTLSGPGGSGKTRLSIGAASELVGEFKNGVFWVGLATVHDPAIVLPTIAQTIGAQGNLAEFVGERELLLLLDNFEQVVDAAPQLADLIEACPNLRLLVTSRELLRVRGEAEYEVLPLADREAIELFTTRTQLDPTPAIEELCRRLDNMPLALELAAARTKALTPERILDRLGQRLDLFKGGRDVEERQATLRSTIEWSHELLSPEEQQLFARLGVFIGGCTLEAAEAVTGADLDTIQSLVEKSLLRHTGDRFWMLETIREYAVERLEGSGDAQDLRRRLAGYFVTFAEATNLSPEGVGRGPMRYDLALAEQDNIRSVLAWAVEHDPEVGLRIAADIEQHWVTNPAEAVRWFEELFDRVGDLPQRVRAAALRTFGGTCGMSGNPQRGRPLNERALELFEELGDEAAAISMRHRTAVDAFNLGDLAYVRATETECAESARAGGYKLQLTEALAMLALLEAGDGNLEQAIDMTREELQLSQEIGFPWFEAIALANLSEFSLGLGRLNDCADYAVQSLQLARTLSERMLTAHGLSMLALVAKATGADEHAGTLWGAVAAERERASFGWTEGDLAKFEGQILDGAGPELDAGVEQGRRLSLEQAVDLALAGRKQPSAESG